MNQYEEVASNLWNKGIPLTKQELAKLAQLIDKASNDIIISMSPAPMKTYLLGYKIQELLKKAGSFAEIKKMLDDFKRPPISDDWSRAKVAAVISKLINVPVRQLKDEMALKFLQDYMFQEITWHMDNMQHKIKTEMIETLMNNESPLQLARRLHKTFDTYDIDMRRVAITETTRARNMGTANAIAQTDPAGNDTMVYFIVAKDACRHCKRLYLYPDGSPRLFKLKDIIHETNKGRKVSEWRAALLIHPNCRCYFVKYDPELMEWKKKWEAKYQGKIFKMASSQDMEKSVIEPDSIKKTMEVNGIQVAIEWPKGSTRTYKDGDWETEMKAHYGRIPWTESSNDKMCLDCYVGDNTDSTKIYKLSQIKKNGEFDENKYMLGYDSLKESKASYLEHMPEWMYGGIKQITMDDFEHIIATNLQKPEVDSELIHLKCGKCGFQGQAIPDESYNKYDCPKCKESMQEIEKAIGDIRLGHKYLRREGEPGKYKYIYADETGKEYVGQEPEPSPKIKRYYYDEELGIPYEKVEQIGFGSEWRVKWPDGNTSIIDTFMIKLKKIKPEEYEKKVKEYHEDEKMRAERFELAKEQEAEEEKEKKEMGKAIGEERPGHKYVRREGLPGNYIYFYKDAQGREYSSKTPPEPQQQTFDFDNGPTLASLYQPEQEAQKIAQEDDGKNVTLYHTTSEENHKSIMKHGLLPGGGGKGTPHPGQEWEPEIKGVYGHDVKEPAMRDKQDTEKMTNGESKMAVYKLTIPKEHAAKHLKRDKEGSAVYTDKVHPEWIQRIDKPEEKPKEEHKPAMTIDELIKNSKVIVKSDIGSAKIVEFPNGYQTAAFPELGYKRPDGSAFSFGRKISAGQWARRGLSDQDIRDVAEWIVKENKSEPTKLTDKPSEKTAKPEPKQQEQTVKMDSTKDAFAEARKYKTEDEFIKKYATEATPEQIKDKTLDLKNIKVYKGNMGRVKVKDVTPYEHDNFSDINKEPAGKKKVKEMVEFLKNNPDKDLPPVGIEGLIDDKEYKPQVKDGHHRTQAYIEAGRKDMPFVYTMDTLHDIYKKANKKSEDNP